MGNLWYGTKFSEVPVVNKEIYGHEFKQMSKFTYTNSCRTEPAEGHKQKEGKRRDEVKLFNPISFCSLLSSWATGTVLQLLWSTECLGKAIESMENEFLDPLREKMNSVCIAKHYHARRPWNCFKEVNLVLNKCNLCLEHLFDKLTF